MLIGIFGGTFDPIHNGHILLAETILSQAHLDEVWFMVTPQNPWKKNNHLSPDRLRFEMVRKALLGHGRLRASDYEFHLPKPSFTYKTLRHLRQDFPQHSFILIMGADNWNAFSRWAEHEEILSHHPIVVYPRQNCPLLDEGKPHNVTFIDTQLFNVSSSQIRDKMKRGESVQCDVPPAVLSYLDNYCNE